MRADSFLAGTHQSDSLQPDIQFDMTILKDRPDRDSKLVFDLVLTAILASIDTWTDWFLGTFLSHYLCNAKASATRARHAVRPAEGFK